MMTHDKYSPTQEKAIACLKAHPSQWLTAKEIWNKAFAETWKNESGLLVSLHELVRKHDNLDSEQQYRFSAGRNRRMWCFKWNEEEVTGKD